MVEGRIRSPIPFLIYGSDFLISFNLQAFNYNKPYLLRGYY